MIYCIIKNDAKYFKQNKIAKTENAKFAYKKFSI